MFILACRRAFHQAFRLWSEASSFTFQEVSANSPSDITIKFTVGSHGDGYSFDGPGNEQDIYVYAGKKQPYEHNTKCASLTTDISK